MRQQEIIIRQLAEAVTDFIEPVILYLVIGSKKAAEEAGKKAGSDVWEIKSKLWRILFSRERPELKEAAGDMVVVASDPKVKQILIQELSKSFEEDSELANEISSFMGDEVIKRIMAEESSVKLAKQSSCDKNNVFEEFNRLLEEFLAQSSTVQDLEQLELQDTETTSPGQEVTPETSSLVRKPKHPYTHIQLNQGITTEGSSASAIRMAKIAEMDVKGQSEAQRFQTSFSLLSQLEGSGKEEFLEKALDFASRIEYGDARSQILSLLVPQLEGPGRVELIEKALYSASNIQDEDERSLVLRSLVPHLRGPGKERLIEDIFAFTFHIPYGDAKFQILCSLVPHLYGSRNERVMERALELASGIQSEYERIESFSLLVPYLTGQRKEEVIEEALQLACNLKDKDVRPEALSFVIPHLNEFRQKEILEKALNIASGIQSEYRKVQALSSLVAYLDEPEKEEIMEKILVSGFVSK